MRRSLRSWGIDEMVYSIWYMVQAWASKGPQKGYDPYAILDCTRTWYMAWSCTHPMPGCLLVSLVAGCLGRYQNYNLVLLAQQQVVGQSHAPPSRSPKDRIDI